MDETWEKAVETALEGQTDPSSVRSLTMDGVVKCVHGRLPPPSVFERFRNLRHLSIASIGVSSLEGFPRLQNLQKLILSDNRIAGGLESLVKAGLDSLRDLDLSNNRIADISHLRPLAKLKLVSLDLYECPVTRVKDYRSSVLGLIESLKYLDKTDAEGNERPESDDEEDEESDEEEDDYDTGSVEVDCEDGSHRATCNGRQSWNDRVIEVDEDESDAEDAELDTSRGAGETNPNRSHNLSNGVRVADDEDDEDGGEDDEDSDWEEEDDDDDDDRVLEVQNIDEDEDEDEEEDDDVEDGEEVDNDDDDDFGEKQSTDVLVSTEGEIDGDGEDSDGDEDDSVENGEENSDDEEEDNGAEYLVQPVVANGMMMMHQEEDGEDDDDDDDGEVHERPPPCLKRKRDSNDDDEEDDDDSDDDDDGADEDDDDDDEDGVLENGKRSSR